MASFNCQNKIVLRNILGAIIVICASLMPAKSLKAQKSRAGLDRFDVVNVGLGMSTRGLPVFVELEQSLDEHISVGLLATYQNFRERGSIGTWQHQYFGIGAQGHYHFVEIAPPPFDFFAGLTFGWYGHQFKEVGGATAPVDYTGSQEGGFQLAGHIGGRYTYKGWTLFTQLTGGSLISGYTFGLSIPLK